jgi:hypothetical protein
MLNIINIKYDIILGISWLKYHDLVVSWKARTLTYLGPDIIRISALYINQIRTPRVDIRRNLRRSKSRLRTRDP